MNYAEARRRSDESGWHYTVRNDDRIWTHQCCRDPGPPATEADVEQYGYQLGEPTLGEPHAPHATREEAEECYHQWRLRKIESSLEFADEVLGDWRGCEAVTGWDNPRPFQTEPKPIRCDQPTKGGARYLDDHHPEHVALCPEHRTAEIVLARVARVTASIYS